MSKRKEEKVTQSGAHARAPAAGGILGGLPIRVPSAGLDTILAATGSPRERFTITFANKKALGYAIVEEVIGPHLRAKSPSFFVVRGCATTNRDLDSR